MILLVFNEKRLALALSDYLRTQGIATHIEPHDDGVALVLDDMNREADAVAIMNHFVRSPDDARYWQASWQAGTANPGVVTVAAGDNMLLNWWQRGGWFTRFVFVVCLLVFAAQKIWPEATWQALRYPDAISVAAIHGEWWRLVTPALLHLGLVHLLFNVLWWWEFASLIERMQSPWRLLGIIVVVLAVSNAAQFLHSGAGFGGLSGVVYGLLGYLWCYPYADPHAPFRIRGVLIAFMLGWLAFGFVLEEWVGNFMANMVHLAGLLTGMALGILLGMVNYRRVDDESL